MNIWNNDFKRRKTTSSSAVKIETKMYESHCRNEKPLFLLRWDFPTSKCLNLCGCNCQTSQRRKILCVYRCNILFYIPEIRNSHIEFPLSRRHHQSHSCSGCKFAMCLRLFCTDCVNFMLQLEYKMWLQSNAVI